MMVVHFTEVFLCFQLNCCGKGQGTSFLTHITDKLGMTDLCPSSGTFFVSLKTLPVPSAPAPNALTAGGGWSDGI